MIVDREPQEKAISAKQRALCNLARIDTVDRASGGHDGDTAHRCQCSPQQIFKYQKKISGPLLDRIDLHVEVPRLPYEKLSGEQKNETSESIKQKVQKARLMQRQRFDSAKTNSEMNVLEIKKFCVLGEEEQKALGQAMRAFNFSGRSLHRILKVARTIADLAGEEKINPDHLSEAIHYRPKSD